MGKRGEGFEGFASQVQPVCVWGSGGGGLGQWDTASWNHALGGAPCLMGGREVNSTAWKLYLIFIHMSAPGRDRLPQTNWNAWDQGGLQRGRQKKTLRMGGGGVHVSMNFRECIRKAEFTDMDGKAQITTAYWFSLHPHTHTHLYYLLSRIKTQLISVEATLLLRDNAYGRLWANSQRSWWLAEQLVFKQALFPLTFFIFLSAWILSTYTHHFLILCPLPSPSLIKHTIK